MKYLRKVTTLRFDETRCTGCGRCFEVCPRNVFEMRGRKAFIVDKDLCLECGACSLNCTPAALSVESGVGCASALITSMLRGGEPVCGCDSSTGGCC